MPLCCLYVLSLAFLPSSSSFRPWLFSLDASPCSPDSPTKSKSQLPNAYSIFFPRGSDLGIMRSKSWRRGGEMQLCWSPLLGRQSCSSRGSFLLAAFGGLLSWGSGGSERRFEVTGTRRVPDDVPRRWCIRYLQSACSTPCLLIASRMRLTRCYCCCEQRSLMLAACVCPVLMLLVSHWFQPPGSGSTQYAPGTSAASGH